jgi:hypothetical protein
MPNNVERAAEHIDEERVGTEALGAELRDAGAGAGFAT